VEAPVGEGTCAVFGSTTTTVPLVDRAPGERVK